MKMLAIHAPLGGGHTRAARALACAAEESGRAVRVADLFRFVPNAWSALLEHGRHVIDDHPLLLAAAYEVEQGRRTRWESALRHELDRALGAPLQRFVDGTLPDVIFATHFAAASVLGEARTSGRFPGRLYVVITDLGVHDWWIEDGVDGYFAGTREVAQQLVRRGVDPRLVFVTGVPVSPALGGVEAADMTYPVKSVLVLGHRGIEPALAGFARKRPVHLSVVTGDDRTLHRGVLHVSATRSLDADVYGALSDLTPLIARAHVIVSRPDGVAVAEALAAGRPLVFTGPAYGEELRNLEAVLEAGAGLAASEPADVADRVLALLGDPMELARRSAAARRLGRPRAAFEVLDIAAHGARARPETSELRLA